MFLLSLDRCLIEFELEHDGVDDWASCKGQTFSSILVVLERRQIVDLLPTRSADSFAERLAQQHSLEERFEHGKHLRDRDLEVPRECLQFGPMLLKMLARVHGLAFLYMHEPSKRLHHTGQCRRVVVEW